MSDKDKLDSLQRQYDNQIPPGWGDKEDEAQDRLDELDKKQARYEDDCNILLEQQGELLEKRGESISEEERRVLAARLITNQAAIMILEPLTVEELNERAEIAEQLRKSNEEK